MKETLFEMLLSLFETTLHQLHEANTSISQQQSIANDDTATFKKHFLTQHNKVPSNVYQMLLLKEANLDSMRVFTPNEQLKLSKASYQFLMKLHTWGVISRDVMEIIIHRLLLSDSHIVSLQETKWAVRTLLADNLSFDQLAYLDLVLYDKEDAIVRH